MRTVHRAQRVQTSITSVTEAIGVRSRRALVQHAEVPEGSSPALEEEHCAESFRYFLRYWRFIDRETGIERSFEHLWPGQEEIARLYEEWVNDFVILLKAGKLGFTELECAWDGWSLMYRQPNARVHAFSYNGTESKGIVRLVKYGMAHLPEWMRLPVAKGRPGGDTSQEVQWIAGRDDTRTLRAYPSTEEASINESCVHAHLDELARMPWPSATYTSAASTVTGSLHVVSRGAGPANEMARLWQQSQQPDATTRGIFIPFTGRPREPQRPAAPDTPQEALNELWYEEQRGKIPTLHGLYHFAPREPAQALAADAEEAYILREHWDQCYEPQLPQLLPGDRQMSILSLDAGITDDNFAASLISRNPLRPDEAALRNYRVWVPKDEGGVVNFGAVEQWLRIVCLGGCTEGHPNGSRRTGGLSSFVNPDTGVACPACQRGDRVQPYSIYQICYDRYQLHDMMQRLNRDGVAWCKEFDQGADRLEADTDLKKSVGQRRFAHSEDPSKDSVMRDQILNAKIKMPKGEDTKGRMEKRSPSGKIDLAVSISMGAHRALYYSL